MHLSAPTGPAPPPESIFGGRARTTITAGTYKPTAPDGWPLWTSPVRPGREHDTTCARAHPELLDTLTDWTNPDHAVLADLGYQSENTD